MKKLSIYLMMLLAVGLTACNEDFNKDMASPQSYEQEEAASKIGFTATGVAPIDLGQIDTERVSACTFTAPTVQNAAFSYKMKLDNKVTIVVDNEGKVATEDLQNAIAQIYGIRPVERTMEAVLTVYVATGGTVYAASAEKFEMKATPKAPMIEGAYYINGTLTWGADVALGSSSGDPYENSIFTVTVPAQIEDETGAKDATFLIKSMSGQLIGTTETGDALEGNLAPSNTPNPIKVSGGDYKSVKISINMMEGTYKIEKMADAPFLWVPGNHQKIWAPKSAPTMFKPEGAGAYWGIAALDGDFKFTGQPYWPSNDNGGLDYGFGYFNTIEGGITGSNNLNLPQGIYYLLVNLDGKYISATKIESVGLIGDAIGGWGDSDEIDMAYDTTQKCWSATTDFTAKGFKIRLNHAWKVAFGGTLEAPSPFSDNIAMDKAGNYTVKFYLNGRIVFIKNN